MAEDYSQGWIDLGSDLDVAEFIRTVHSLSSAQGKGFLDDKKGILPDSEIQPYLTDLAQDGRTRMDYIRGRSIKMSIHMHEGHYLIRDGAWYDHNDGEFNELLARFGISRRTEQEHGCACQCDDCQPNHPIRDPERALGLCSITVLTPGTANLSEDASPTFLLKNGSTEAKGLVAAVMMTLDKLMVTKPIVIYEITMLCRDPNHKPFGNCGEDLVMNELAVREAGGKWKVDQSIQNIVLSAVRGEEMQDITLGSPVK